MDASIEIRNKRKLLGLTIKEFSDAIGLGRNGDKLFRAWEAGTESPSKEQMDTILNLSLIHI